MTDSDQSPPATPAQPANHPAVGWQPIETAPTDGREILCCSAGGLVRVCVPKLFPRPIHPDGGDMRKPRIGDRWEHFRDDEYAPGHAWSMIPTHWMPLPEPPQ